MRSPNPAPQRREVIYSGHVQGVGFRYTTQAIAAQFAVTGYVRNLPDGRVELMAEGTKAELDAFFQEIARKMREYINNSRSLNRRASYLAQFNGCLLGASFFAESMD